MQGTLLPHSAAHVTCEIPGSNHINNTPNWGGGVPHHALEQRIPRVAILCEHVVRLAILLHYLSAADIEGSFPASVDMHDVIAIPRLTWTVARQRKCQASHRGLRSCWQCHASPVQVGMDLHRGCGSRVVQC